MVKLSILRVTLAFALGAGTANSFAQVDIRAPAQGAYAQDSNGNVARSQFGLCWRSGFWTPGDALPGCDGQLVPPIPLKATAPDLPGTVPAPVPVLVATTPPCDAAVTLTNEQTFEFNRTELTSLAQERIRNEVLGRLDSCARVDVILVTGHTDRMGTASYNKRLSEKRALAVANFLKSQGVNAPINTKGAGSSQPLTACSNKLSRKKLIACLAPNRRVVIDVRGPGS
jgi:OOP family OmpA-OmpF porin